MANVLKRSVVIMKVHYIQHVSFEDPGNILRWCQERGHVVRSTKLFADEVLPEVDDFDWLVVMGGPMGVDDEFQYPWLKQEKRFLEQVVQTKDKIVLGICLGAQLIAQVLGSTVTKNVYPEIGWYPVHLTPAGLKHPFFTCLPPSFTALHWHGDTFSIPAQAIHIAQSEACSNQAFVLDNRIIGLQFHLETTPTTLAALIKNCPDDLQSKHTYVQSPEELLDTKSNFDSLEKHLFQLLDTLFKHWIDLKER
ncbi:MAG: type 1 glutamine amidotransferase [Desulfonauticus sp.]|nr:type 1 glutamine amidotransferase [Desulfonauticus sp.]